MFLKYITFRRFLL